MSEKAARLVIEAGRRHRYAVTSWASLEAIEEFSGESSARTARNRRPRVG